MRYLSLFSGIGGFELGITQAYDNNYQQTASILKDGQGRDGTADLGPALLHDRSESPLCIGFSEIDKYATAIYQSHFPTHKNYGDITKIRETDLPDFDLLVGGFPCQSFSIAGKRGGFSDTRGTMFFEIARILKHKQPRLLLLENVKGLLSHDEGRTFATIIAALDELGYDLGWQVLNSKNHGVPQNRERVFIVGHLRGESRPQVFPFYGSNPNHIEEITEPVPQAQRVYSEDGISPTIDIGAGGNRQPKVISKTIRAGGLKSPHDSKQNWDSYEHEGRIRRLTPTECERLQGFPDGWTEGVSDTQRYKCLGNAVTVNVIRDITSALLSNSSQV